MRSSWHRHKTKRSSRTTGSTLVVQQLGDIRRREEAGIAQVEVQRFSEPVDTLIFNDRVRLALNTDRRRKHRIHDLRELDIVAVDDLATRLVSVVRVPDLESKLIEGATEEIFRTVSILVDPIQDLRDCVDGDSDGISEHVAIPRVSAANEVLGVSGTQG